MTSFSSRSENPSPDGGAGTGVEELAEQFLERLRAGEQPDVEQYAAAYPHLADEIRAIFPTLALLDECAPRRESIVAPPLPADVPAQLGEYRIIREVGRGGMGVVYEAEHATMRRRVALKVLAHHVAANPGNLQRFLRETRVAGRLHHTNIVPVYEFGTDRGTHYYAMQFIHGQNLDLVIEELQRLRAGQHRHDPGQVTTAARREPTGIHGEPTIAEGFLAGQLEPRASYSGPHRDRAPDDPLGEVRSAPARSGSTSSRLASAGSESGLIKPEGLPRSKLSADYFRRAARAALQVAEALSYAHAHGVLHRDIKPSNLILDTEGVVWVTDFGLAKHENEDFTQTGDIVGTLRYMAPERFQGITDARSDIYSLGLTLFELCTLRSAFEQSDRVRLMRDITEGQVVQPRSVEPAMPRDLETIILKAVQREPARRYATADDLAEDLRRLLEDRPILARRTTPGEQLLRWCRRNPTVAALLGCTLLLLAILVAGSLTFAYHAQDTAERLARAHREATKRLYESHLGRAQAQRWSRRPGQHYEALRALQQAAGILPELPLEAAEISHARRTLRNEVIAALPLFDLSPYRSWEATQPWVASVAFDADYKRYAQSDQDGRIQIRRTSDDVVLTELPGTGYRAWSLQFSPSGQYLSCTYHHGPPQPTSPIIRVWDLAARRPLIAVDANLYYAPYAFRADSQRFAVGLHDGTVQMYELPTGRPAEKRSLGRTPMALVFAPDRERLAVCDDGSRQVTLWDYVENKVVMAKSPEPLTSLAWSAYSGLLAGGTDSGNIYLWDLPASPGEPLRLAGHAGRVTRLFFAHHSELLASMAWDSSVRLWDTRVEEQVLRMDRQYLTHTGFRSDDGELAFTDVEHHFGTWLVARGGPLQYLQWERGAQERWMVDFHPSQPWLLASATTDGVELWDVQQRRRLNLLEMGRTRSALFTPDGRSLVCSSDSGVTRWELDIQHDGDQWRVSARGPETLAPGRRFRVDVGGSGQVLALPEENGRGVIRALDPARASEFPTRTLEDHPLLDRLVLSPDARWAVSTTWHGVGIRAWDSSGQFVELEPTAGSATAAFSPDGRRLVATMGDRQILWEVGTWKRLFDLPRQRADGWPGPAAFSPDSQLVVLPWTRFVAQLVDTRSGESLAILESPRLVSLAWYDFSPDNRYLAIAEPSCIQLWDLALLRQHLAGMALDWYTTDPTDQH